MFEKTNKNLKSSLIPYKPLWWPSGFDQSPAWERCSWVAVPPCDVVLPSLQSCCTAWAASPACPLPDGRLRSHESHPLAIPLPWAAHSGLCLVYLWLYLFGIWKVIVQIFKKLAERSRLDRMEFWKFITAKWLKEHWKHVFNHWQVKFINEAKQLKIITNVTSMAAVDS